MEKESIEIRSPQFRNRRGVDIYLPDSYAEGRRRYPAVYMQDGQNLSDPSIAFGGNTWRLEDGLKWLAQRGVEPIVIGIHNTEERLSEYSPFPDPRHGGGEGDRYVRFLIDTVKPRIDGAYRTKKDRDSTVIAGSSMGGLISLYAFFRRSETFGLCGAMSPAFWFGRAGLFDVVRKVPFVEGRIYLDTGTREIGRLPFRRANRRNSAGEMYRLLRQRGYVDGVDLRYVVEKDGEHNEAAWGRRLPDALRFLLKTVP